MEMREGLIIGGACEAGEIYRSVVGGKSDEEIKDVMSFYDYVEIQPIANNAYMIEKGSVKDEDELKDINRKIYDKCCWGNSYNFSFNYNCRWNQINIKSITGCSTCNGNILCNSRFSGNYN